MSGGGSSTNTIEKADPWDPIQPYLKQAAKEWQNIYNQGAPDYYPGQTYVDPNQLQTGAVNQLADYAGSLSGLAGTGLSAQGAMFDPFSNPYSQLSLSSLYPSMGAMTQLMGGAGQATDTAGMLQNMGLNYSPGIYTPIMNIAGYADPNQALAQMMYGQGNPYLDQMVGAAQQNLLQNYDITTGMAADAFESQMLPQIQDARSLITDALGQFTDVALPQITDQGLRTGTSYSTRQDLAQGAALGNIYDTLNRDLTNLARTSELTGGNIYQDMLRNQAMTLDDAGAMAQSMYGGAWDQQQQNILNAAGIGANLQGNWQDAILRAADLDLERQLAGEGLSRDWASLALDASLGAGGLAGDAAGQGMDLFGDIYGQNYDTLFRGLTVLPQTLQAGAIPSQLMGAAGDQLYQWQQMPLQAAMDRWNYEQGAQQALLSDYSNALAMLGGMGGMSTGYTDTAGNPLMGAMGGAAMGYAAAGAIGSMVGGGGGAGAASGASAGSVGGPYTAALGALIGYLLSS
jgi:hypothetical protein